MSSNKGSQVVVGPQSGDTTEMGLDHESATVINGLDY